MGSSSRRSSGSWASARATRSRRRSPPESVETMRPARWAMASSSSAARATARSCAPGSPHPPRCGERPISTSSSPVKPESPSKVCGTQATRRASARRSQRRQRCPEELGPRAGDRRQEPEDGAEQGALPRAVRPEHRPEAARPDVQRHLGDHRDGRRAPPTSARSREHGAHAGASAGGSSHTKSGPPSTAVTTPTGGSAWNTGKSSRVRRSAITRNAAPPSGARRHEQPLVRARARVGAGAGRSAPRSRSGRRAPPPRPR